MAAQRRPVLMWWLTAVVIGMVLFSAVLSARSLLRLVTAQEALTQALQVDKALQTLQLHLVNAETGQRGYLLTGRVGYLEPYFEAREALQRERRRLDGLPQAHASSPAQQHLRDAVATKMAEMDQTVRLYDAGEVDEALERVRSDAGKRSMDAVRAAGEELTAAEERLTATRSAEHRAAVVRAAVVLAASLLLNLLLLGGLVDRMRANGRDSQRSQAAMTLHNTELARLLEATGVRNAQVHALTELSRYLQSALDIDEASQLLQRHLPRLLQARSGALYLMAASRNQLRSACTWGAGSWAELLEPSACWALRRGQPLQQAGDGTGVTCAHLDGTHGPGAPAAGTECLPLVAHGDLVGLLVLALDVGEGRQPEAEDLEFQQMTLEQVALCIGNLRLRESLRQQSIRDVLTGLYNRRYLEESAQRELLRAERLQTQGPHPGLALLMLDVDHFKRFNDQHGHETGDRVLRDVAQVLQRATRGSDVAARHGGEEFVVLLPGADACAAMHRAEQLRRDVEQLELRVDGQVVGPVTLSVGVAHWPQDGATTQQLLQAADKALYEAKRTGRNRVMAAGPAQDAAEGAPAAASAAAERQTSRAMAAHCDA